MPIEILRAGVPKVAVRDCCAIGIMIKTPRIGFSKTRLCPPLDPAEAAGLSRCFLQDTTSALAALAQKFSKVDGIAIYTPTGSEHTLEGLLPAGFKMIAQRSGDFGERLFGAVEDLFSVGYDSVCLLDSDSPTLPPRFLQQMVKGLSESKEQMVIGPCVDGGYYALGLRQSHRRIFEQITWSTNRVYQETLQRASELALRVVALPPWYDVDDQASLEQLLADLFRPGPKEKLNTPLGEAPATKAFLKRILEKEGESRIWPGSSQRAGNER